MDEPAVRLAEPAVRLAELVGGLSVVSDLGKGLDDGQGIRSTVLALELADAVALPPDERAALFWIGLLRFVGCTATAADMAAALGDELAVSEAFATADAHDLRDVLRGAVAAVGRRPDRIVAFLAKAPGVVREHEIASCEVASVLARDFGLPEEVRRGVAQIFERWDGKGNPGHDRGGTLGRPVRVWQVAHVADLLRSQASPQATARRLRTLGGRTLDPVIAAVGAELVVRLGDRAPHARLEDLLDLEPEPWRMVSGTRLDAVLGAFGLIADLKSPYFLGHSERVARLASAAARVAGFDEQAARLVGRAALVHDIGRVAVSSRVWNRQDALTDIETEQVRTHPYFTQRVLARVPALSGLADLAGSHHERCDGSGYHRGLTERALTPGALLLATADRWVTAGESRPHRPAYPRQERAALLRTDAEAGRLPRSAVEAVLTAAGAPTAKAAAPSNRLTPRELQVLRAVSSGLTDAAAGRHLGISAKTVNSHLEHIYAKLGVSTRASAVVAANRRGWLDLAAP